jgi:hypothetical protein
MNYTGSLNKQENCLIKIYEEGEGEGRKQSISTGLFNDALSTTCYGVTINDELE